mgnify:CR=1 FL=1
MPKRSPAAPAIPVHQANLPGDAQVAWEQQRFGQLKAEVESLDDEPRSLYLQGLRAELLARGGLYARLHALHLNEEAPA